MTFEWHVDTDLEWVVFWTVVVLVMAAWGFVCFTVARVVSEWMLRRLDP